MYTTAPSSPLSRRATQESSGGQADPRGARRFRALLEDAAAPPDGALQAPQALPAPPLVSPAPTAPSRAGACSTRASAAAAPPPPHPPPHALDAQTHEVRVSQGPLAGLLVQASLQGARLGLRLSVPPSVLAERLQRGRAPLAAALSAALGVDVELEVQREP